MAIFLKFFDFTALFLSQIFVDGKLYWTYLRTLLFQLVGCDGFLVEYHLQLILLSSILFVSLIILLKFQFSINIKKEILVRIALFILFIKAFFHCGICDFLGFWCHLIRKYGPVYFFVFFWFPPVISFLSGSSFLYFSIM
jgi:hypothetical protein